MIKFYPRLHIAINHLKKQFFRAGLLLLLILQLGNDANGQCIPPPPVSVTPTISCGGVISAGPCNPLTATGADTYVWTPVAGLFTNCTHTIPYTGGNASTVFAAPITATTYTVTGTVTATGCTATATAFVNATPPAPVVVPSSVSMCVSDPPVKLKISRGPVTSLFCSGPVNIAVPDNNVAGSSNSINVSGLPLCVVNSITVQINMTHARIGDMVFVLKGPNGQILNLDYHLTATGGSGAGTGFVNTVISSVGTAALSTGTNPYTGTFRADAQISPGGGFGPAGPTGMAPTINTWNSLFTSLNGTWTLGFYDGVTSQTGTLTSWCLSITTNCGGGFPSLPGVWSPAAGLFLDPAATVPYVAGTATDSLWVKPTPAGVYTYQVTTSSVPVSTQSFTNPTPILIPVGGPATLYPSPLTVVGLPVTGVVVRSVTLHNINHTRSQDIDVVLQSPSGQNVVLMSDAGGNTAAIAAYTFNDAAPLMNNTTANPTGTYRPTNFGTPDNFAAPGPGNLSQSSPALAMFTGNYNGVWNLFVMDDDGSSDQGMISGGYTIVFDVPGNTCTSPATSVVVTVGPNAVITTQPANQNICLGSNALFNVVATGSGLSYQWQVSTNGGATFNNLANGGLYSGITTGSLTITAPPVSMSGQLYRVVVNGGVCGSATSNSALLTVNQLPNIVIGPSSYIVLYPAQTTTLTSAVTPNPAATYSWLRNGIPVPGGTSATLLVDFSQLGLYRLNITDINGCSNVSDTIRVTDSIGSLRLYPNPSSGNFQVRQYLEPNTVKQLTVTVYNNMGTKVFTRSYTQTISYEKIDVDIRRNGKGLYWVEILDSKGKRVSMSRVAVQ